MQMLDDGPRDREAIVGRGAAADFVEDDERTVGGVVEDVRRLVGSDLDRWAFRAVAPL